MSYAPSPIRCSEHCPRPLCCSAPTGSVFLIERGQSEGFAFPEWWSWQLGGMWTTDPYLASRYPDALAAAHAVRDHGLLPARAINHFFDPGPGPTCQCNGPSARPCTCRISTEAS